MKQKLLIKKLNETSKLLIYARNYYEVMQIRYKRSLQGILTSFIYPILRYNRSLITWIVLCIFYLKTGLRMIYNKYECILLKILSS